MNIILLEKIKKLGDIGDEVKVKSGYARNFLVPNKKALYATSENRKYFEEKKTDIKSQNDKLIKDAKEKLKKISGQEVTLIRAASDSGQLFGSVSTKDIVNSLAEKNISILKNEIDLNKSIKNLTYENVTINLHPEVSCEIILNVARSSEEASTQKKLGKAVTSNSENEDNKTETSKELSVQDEVKTDEKPEKINQEVDLLNEDDKLQETEASTEKNKTLDSDTAGK
jgi:large subunit ribosomal protein L9